MILLIAIPLAALALASDSPAESWDGTWHSGDGKPTELTLARTENSIHVKEEHNNKVVLDYTCKLDGKECEMVDDGHKAKVSVWTNGPKLVELRTRGSDVTRRRFTPKDAGKSLEVEEAELSSGGKTETLQFKRTP